LDVLREARVHVNDLETSLWDLMDADVGSAGWASMIYEDYPSNEMAISVHLTLQ
jgi:hypothetical protein